MLSSLFVDFGRRDLTALSRLFATAALLCLVARFYGFVPVPQHEAPAIANPI
jgi:hypothetical protein